MQAQNENIILYQFKYVINGNNQNPNVILPSSYNKQETFFQFELFNLLKVSQLEILCNFQIDNSTVQLGAEELIQPFKLQVFDKQFQMFLDKQNVIYFIPYVKYMSVQDLKNNFSISDNQILQIYDLFYNEDQQEIEAQVQLQIKVKP